MIPPSFLAEEERIRAAYARRAAKDRQPGLPPGRLFQMQERERQVLRILQRHEFLPLAAKRILEVGCGSGTWLRDFIRWGARPENLFGIDLLPASIAEARRLSPVDVTVECGSATNLPFAAGTWDLVLQATMFTSVLDPEAKRRMASEMLRVLRPGGLILWYDFHVNNPWNSDVRGVARREIRELFGECPIQLRSISLAPPLARWLAPRSWLACYILTRIPLFCTHYLGVIRKLTP